MVRLRTLAIVVVLVALLSILGSWQLHLGADVFLIHRLSHVSPASDGGDSAPRYDGVGAVDTESSHTPSPLLMSYDSVASFFGRDAANERRTRRVILGAASVSAAAAAQHEGAIASTACSVAEVFRDIAMFAYFSSSSAVDTLLRQQRHQGGSASDSGSSVNASAAANGGKRVQRCQAAFAMSCRDLFARNAALKGVVVEWFHEAAATTCESVENSIAFVEPLRRTRRATTTTPQAEAAIAREASSLPLVLVPSQQLIVDTRDAVELLRRQLWRVERASGPQQQQPLSVERFIATSIAPSYAVRSSGSALDAARRVPVDRTNLVVLGLREGDDRANAVATLVQRSFEALVSVDVVRPQAGAAGGCDAGGVRLSSRDLGALVSAHVVIVVAGGSAASACQRRLARAVRFKILPLLLPGTIVLDATASRRGDFETEALASWLSLDYSPSLRLFELAYSDPAPATAPFETYFSSKGSGAGETDGAGGTGAFRDTAARCPTSLATSRRLMETLAIVGGGDGDGDDPGQRKEDVPSATALFAAVREALATSYARRYRFSNVRAFDMRRN